MVSYQQLLVGSKDTHRHNTTTHHSDGGVTGHTNSSEPGGVE